MRITPVKINQYLFFKLPLAWLSGMRVKSIDPTKCVVAIKFRWINQNPFRSMFWAAQGMAAEMSTGALVLSSIQNSGKKVSMLVTRQEGNFTKKATGLIRFQCNDGKMIASAIQKSAETGEGQTVIMKSEGVNSEGVLVATFLFHWGIKVKE